MMYLDENGRKQFNIPQMEPFLKYPDIVEVLPILKHENLSDLVDCEGTTVLHLFAKYNNQLLVDHLIRNEHFAVDAVNSSNETPLMYLIQNNYDVGTLKMLFEAGADLWKIKNNSGHTALTMIIQKYSYDNDELIAKVLMDELDKRCCNIEEITSVLLNAGCQPYHLKVFQNAEVTKLMIQRGFQVNVQNPDDFRNTALHVAAECNDVDIVKVLLELGADKNIENAYSRMPIEEALRIARPKPEIIKLLFPDDKDWLLRPMNIFTVFQGCTREVLELLLQHCDIDFSARDVTGRTPLHYLVVNWHKPQNFWGSLRNITLEVNIEDRAGQTPLYTAVLNGNVKAVRFLLDAGANVNAPDELGRSPLFQFSGRGQNSDREIVELLLQKGADAQLVDTYGSSMIWELRNYDVLDSILRHLTLLEAQGSTLNTIVLNDINMNSFAKDIFTKYRLELDKMKRKKIADTVTYFNFMIDEDEKIYKYVKNVEVVNELSKCENTSYFHQRLIKRFERAMEINRYRRVASQLIKECIRSLNANDLIIDIILDFLHYSDWELMASDI